MAKGESKVYSNRLLIFIQIQRETPKWIIKVMAFEHENHERDILGVRVHYSDNTKHGSDAPYWGCS